MKPFLSSSVPVLMLGLACFCFGPRASAAEFLVRPSANEITEDENVAVAFQIDLGPGDEESGDILFDAPDFEQFDVMRSQGMQSVYINGSNQTTRSLTVEVKLHPKKTGKLGVRNIRVEVDGKYLRAPDLLIDVLPRGQLGRGGSPNYGSQYNQRSQLPQGSLRGSRQSAGNLVVRTEPNKVKAYKGEQILLTYALYTQVPLTNVAAERYPNVPGFLKEEIEMPILTRLRFSPSILGGQRYQRAVLAQYAIYPVKEGALSIDPLTTKVTVRASLGGLMGDDDDDNFFGMTNFFRALQGQVVTRTSERMGIEVLPLPSAGRPADFQGLVGDFDISMSVDKQSLKVGEALNAHVRVEGDGHAAILEKLRVEWPPEFELYEDKAKTSFEKTGEKAGRTAREFDFMLIPKAKGVFSLPSIPITMFNPKTGKYEMRQTSPVRIEVAEGPLGQAFLPSKKAPDANATAPSPPEDVRYWMTPSGGGGVWPWALGAGLFCAGLSFAAAQLLPLAFRRKAEAARARRQLFERLSDKAAKLPSGAAPAFLAGVESILAQGLELSCRIKTGSTTRPEMRRMLIEKGADPALALRIEAFLERCENLRFMPASDALGGAAAEIREELLELLSEIDVNFLEKKGALHAHQPPSSHPIDR